MHPGIYTSLIEIALEYDGIGSGDASSVEPRWIVVAACSRNSYREATLAETEFHPHIDALLLFKHFVEPYYAYIGHAHRDSLRDVVVAQVQHMERKTACFGYEFAMTCRRGYTCVGQKGQGVFVKATLILYCDGEHCFVWIT